MSQQDALLVMLREKGDEGVTPLEALDRIGSFRLAAVVFDLRADGHDIETRWYTTPGGKRVARYVLREKVQLTWPF